MSPFSISYVQRKTVIYFLKRSTKSVRINKKNIFNTILVFISYEWTKYKDLKKSYNWSLSSYSKDVYKSNPIQTLKMHFRVVQEAKTASKDAS